MDPAANGQYSLLASLGEHCSSPCPRIYLVYPNQHQVKKKATHRRIRPHILRHARRLSHRIIQDIPEHTRRRRLLGILASAAGKL